MAKEDNISFGWAGKIARVNLTTGAITVESTDPYKQYIGGMGIANKIMYDEVPAGTDPLAPESKVIFAVGPLTASGVPLAGRTTLAHLSTSPKTIWWSIPTWAACSAPSSSSPAGMP